MKYAQTPLKVIVVASHDLQIIDRVGSFRFVVILGDCVLPGHIIGRYETEEEANAACIDFADHYKLRRHPYTEPHRFGPVLRLIEGGASDCASDPGVDNR